MANRDYLKNLIIDYYQSYPEEAKNNKSRFLDLLETNSGCFDRDCFDPGHFTASTWIIDHTGKNALLMHHAKLDKWLQPGGHCDGESDVLAVALKELKEETGLEDVEVISSSIFDLDIHPIPARRNEPEHYHFDIRFLVKCKRDLTLEKNHESKDLKWFSIDKTRCPNQQDSILRMFDKWEKIN